MVQEGEWMTKHVLLTGGAGYIGSHTCLALLDAGYQVSLLDNFENAQDVVPKRLEEISGKKIPVIAADIRDGDRMQGVFADGRFDAVVHFAGLKSVEQSMSMPLEYYQTNVSGLINVVSAMRAHQVNHIVFSSSAAVYGNATAMPIDEETAAAPLNSYARTKLVGEEFLTAFSKAHPGFCVGLLRYFNPVGAHPSGLIGEDPSQPPANLMPILDQVALGKRAEVLVFGDDYPTSDGTGVRDYIHVQDLARGHVLSMAALFDTGENHLVNLGTGRGYSVQQVIEAYRRVNNCRIDSKVVDRRPGDAAESYAGTTRAQRILGFEAQYDLDEMVRSSWRFATSQAEKLSAAQS